MPIKFKKLPSKEILHELFDYDSDTGNLIRKVTTSHNAKAGSVAGTNKWNGYRDINVQNTLYKQHRLVYVWHHGDIPDGYEIDHLDNNRSNNKIENLKAIPHKDNHRKMLQRRDNKSGVTGVRWSEAKKRWVVDLQVNYQVVYIGVFKNKDDAIEARRQANIKYGFAETHGFKKQVIDDTSNDQKALDNTIT